MSVIRSAVTGVGSFLPEQVVTNADLAKIVDTSDEWIQERTGIRQRHKARDDQPTSDLAVEAARKALIDAGRTAAEVVEFRRTGWADLFGAQFGIGQCGDL